jgi:isopentenyl diphosphate isomerase/L-lactate dehydrogenase-like FMN-dependent dehydrogenase
MRACMGGALSWGDQTLSRRVERPDGGKGILHPQDAEKAVALGAEGIWLSNHGGRQIEALVPSIDVLPAIVAAVGKKATILLDSGVRSGQDVMRALAPAPMPPSLENRSLSAVAHSATRSRTT